MTAPDFRSLAEDALACMIASYGDTPVDDVAQSIRARCGMAVNAHAMGLVCGHDECFPLALGAVFHATVVLAEQAGFDLLEDLQDAVNAIRVLQETRRVVDKVFESPGDTAPPAGVVGERDTHTVPPDSVGVGDLPDVASGESSGTGTGNAPSGAGATDDLTPPHGTPRPSAARLSRDGRVFVPVIGEPEFNVIPFPAPTAVPSPLDQVGRALFEVGRRLVRRYRRKT